MSPRHDNYNSSTYTGHLKNDSEVIAQSEPARKSLKVRKFRSGNRVNVSPLNLWLFIVTPNYSLFISLNKFANIVSDIYFPIRAKTNTMKTILTRRLKSSSIQNQRTSVAADFSQMGIQTVKIKPKTT